jgi:NAD(P)-dependent dehydrogenase (short-subunit alcohol dehydrogenase family)
MMDNLSGEDEALSHIAYGYSKQLLSAYVCLKSSEFAQRGIRINAIGPGPTDTPLMASTPTWQDFAAQDFQARLGIPTSTPEQQAYPLLFLCTEAASYVSGQILNVDGGYIARALSGEFDSVLVQPVVSNRNVT